MLRPTDPRSRLAFAFALLLTTPLCLPLPAQGGSSTTVPGERRADPTATPATATREAIDQKAIEWLRQQGLEHSQVMDHLSWICDVHGPRLTGSPNLRRAQEWAMQTFRGWGLANVHLAPWGPFGRGWQLDRFSLHVTGDNPWPVLAWPKAWSPSLDGRVEAEVVDVSAMTAEELEQLDLTGKIVLIDAARDVSEGFEAEARRLDSDELLALATGAPRRRSAETRDQARDALARGAFPRRNQVLAKVNEKRPLAICDRGSKGDYGTIFVQGAAALAPAPPSAEERAAADATRGDGNAPARRGAGGGGRGPSAYAKGAVVIPQLTLAVEHYNRIQRMLKKGVAVKVALELQSTFFDGDGMQHNVIAEIPGVDPQLGEQLVMLGAHFDSWHSGTGATDNGCGSAVMMEAMRLLHGLCAERGQGPRRTIRVALWSGEEQGLLGSRAYVGQEFASGGGRSGEPLQTKPAFAKLSGYFNLDNGTGRIRGVYLQGNEAVAPIFREWLRPFHDLDATVLTLGDTGGTDHLAFDAVGLPGFQFVQDPVAYSPRTHHSNMDNWDHAIGDDLKQAATIVAAFVWHAAQRDEMLPRKPMPEPSARAPGGRGERGGRRGGAEEARPGEQRSGDAAGGGR